MSLSGCLSLARRVACLGAAVFMGVGVANAQLASSNSSDEPTFAATESSSHDYSSSNDSVNSESRFPEPASPAIPAAGGGQYDNRSGRPGRHYAFQAGGGFNAPIGND